MRLPLRSIDNSPPFAPSSSPPPDPASIAPLAHVTHLGHSAYLEGVAQEAPAAASQAPVSFPSLPGSLRLAPLTLVNLPALRALRERVLAHLPDPDCYRREPDEPWFLRAHFLAPQLCLGIFAETTLVAYGMLRMPMHESTHHPIHYITHSRPYRAIRAALHGMEEVDAMCESTSQLTSCMVDSAYRGRGLQRYLIEARIDAGSQRGATRFWAMVAPGNHISQGNLRAAGFHYVATREIAGHARHIVMRDFHRCP